MEILESLEVRWFLPSDAPAGPVLEKWFAAIRDEGDRVDHYLATGRNDLNFKARLAEGKPSRVETKYLVGSLGVTDLAPKMSGELQRWTKLSLVLDDPQLRQHGAWLAVTKKRRLRKFAVTMTSGTEAKEVPAAEYASIGCGVELTRLDYAVDGAACVEWTFGLEAFGPKSQLRDVLTATLRAIAAQFELPELPAEWTASYASWLLPKVAVKG